MKRSIPSVKSAIYQWFRKYLGSEEWTEEILLIQRVFLHAKNQVLFKRVFERAMEQYRLVKEVEVREKVEESEQWTDFELPVEQFYNEHADEKMKARNYAYDPCYLNRDRSTDGTGKTNIMPAEQKETIGVLYEMTEDQLKRLDEIEKGYYRILIHVEWRGEIKHVQTYVAVEQKINNELLPTAEYLGHLIKGASDHSFPEEYQTFLKSFKVVNET